MKPSPAPRIEPTSQPGEDFLALLEQINERLLRIEMKLQPRQSLRDGDAATLSRLLPAIGGKLGSDPFATKEIFADAVLRTMFGGLSRRKAGKLLARAAGVS